MMMRMSLGTEDIKSQKKIALSLTELGYRVKEMWHSDQTGSHIDAHPCFQSMKQHEVLLSARMGDCRYLQRIRAQ